MKARNLSLVVLILVTLVTFSTFLRGYAGEERQHQPAAQPTPAPVQLQEDLGLDSQPAAIPLAKPLETSEEVLQQLAAIDAAWAEWEIPWNADTLAADPDRIIVESFSSRAEESKAMGMNEWFHPSIEADAGSVWSVTIRGNVRLRMIGSGIDGPVSADGVSYVISARTGNLLAIRSGVPERFKLK